MANSSGKTVRLTKERGVTIFRKVKVDKNGQTELSTSAVGNKAKERVKGIRNGVMVLLM